MKYIIIFSIFLLSLVSIVIMSVFLMTHEFDNIAEDSLLKYLVDKEIRGLPIIKESTNVSYKSYPVDSTSRGFDAVTLDVKDKDVAYKHTVDYFIALGYKQENNFVLLKNESEVTIDQMETTMKVTKYSWD